MDKKRLDEWIPYAYDALEDLLADEAGKINKTYRGQISNFGVSVINGTLLSAILFYQEPGNASTERQLLLEAIKKVLDKDPKIKKESKNYDALYEYAIARKNKNEEKIVRDEIITAATALKLAMNLYELEETK